MPQSYKFNIGRNETFKVLATLPATKASTIPLDITDYTFYGKVRENYTTDEIAAEFTITKVEPYSSGSIIIELENTKTKILGLQKYVYDIIAESGSFKRRILEGYLTIRPDVTKFEYLLPETREYQAQFAISPFLVSSSTSLRPDAVSFDYKTAFTLGPTDIGAGGSGLFDKVWKIRADDQNNVWYSVEEGTGWSTEQLLMTYAGNPIIELDAAFEQLGRINFVAQRNTGTGDTPEVWLYWFDPIQFNFVFQNLGSGRTPRISLDDWQTPSRSDVLVFYIDDTENKIRYRVQRERFEIVNNTPVTTTQNTYLEKVGFAVDNRYRVTYSERNTTTGKYELKQLASISYPRLKTVSSESHIATGSAISAILYDIVITSSLFNTEQHFATGSIISASIQDIIKTGSLLSFPEQHFATGSIISASIRDIIKTSSLGDVPESYYVTGSFVTASTQEIVITKTLSEESYYVTGSMQSVEVIVL